MSLIVQLAGSVKNSMIGLCEHAVIRHIDWHFMKLSIRHQTETPIGSDRAHERVAVQHTDRHWCSIMRQYEKLIVLCFRGASRAAEEGEGNECAARLGD